MHAADGLDISVMLVLGLTSSLHCAAMCGPIVAVASAPLEDEGARRAWGRLALWHVAYHAGRGMAYASIGGLLGLVGTALTALFDARRVGGGIQVAVGLALIVLAVRHVVRRPVEGVGRDGVFPRLMRRLVTSGRDPGMFGLGLLTGLLPCGVLYAAFARAVASTSAFEGAALMVAFWLGSIPLLAAVGMASGGLFRALGRYSAVLVFIAMVSTGGWVAAKGCRNLAIAPPAVGEPGCRMHGSPMEIAN